MHALLLAAALASAPLSGDLGEPPQPSAPALANGSGSSTRSVVLPGLVLLGLAGAAFVLARRKRATFGRHLVEVIETTSLGPRRSLVLARVGDELLVLGVSEAGVALLSSRPSPAAADPSQGTRPSQGVRPHQHESLEDAELRRKLQQGGSGSIR